MKKPLDKLDNDKYNIGRDKKEEVKNVSEEEKGIIETIAQAVDILPPLQRERLLGQAEGVLLHAEAVRAKEKAPDEPGQEEEL